MHSNEGLKGELVNLVPVAQAPEDDEEPVEEEIEKPPVSRKTQQSVSHPPPMDVVLKAVREWFTPDSLQWIRGQQVSAASESANESTKPAVRQLESQLERLSLQAFISGTMEYAVEDVKEKFITQEDTIPIVMPTVDSSSQKVLRRKIVMDYLENGLNKMSKTTKLRFSEIQHELRDLVSTFHLTPESITFRPTEIPILCTILLVL